MPDLLSLLRRLWPWQPDNLGDSLDQASKQLGERLSSASQELGYTLDDAAQALGWDRRWTDREHTGWSPGADSEGGWNGQGWSTHGQAGGGGGGGFGGPVPDPAPVSAPAGGLWKGGAALLLVGLLVAGGSQALGLWPVQLETESAPGQSVTGETQAHLNGVAPERLLQAQVMSGGQPAADRPVAGNAHAPSVVTTSAQNRPCADRDGWYELPPTPTPTPLPRPLGCQVGKTLQEPPRMLAFFWQPQHPTLGSQQPVWRTEGDGRVAFSISAQGGHLYQGTASGGGCHLVAQNDPLVRIELDWVLLPPSAGWIEGKLSQRYYEAYSRAREQGIQCVVVWEGYSQQVETVYPDWQPLDPGLYGVRVHLYSARGYALRATPVPVYLRDSSLGE